MHRFRRKVVRIFFAALLPTIIDILPSHAMEQQLGSTLSNVTVTVTDNSALVPGASVRIGDVVKQTDTNGKATFSIRNESVDCSVVKEGYDHKLFQTKLNGDTELYVVIARTTTQPHNIINDRSAAILYTPLDNRLTKVQEGWVHANLGSQMVNQSYDSDYHTTYVRGAVASLSFVGTQIKVFVQGVPRGGLAEVRLDGSNPVVVNTVSPERQDYMSVYEKYGLAPGNHQLEIRVLGQNNQGVGGNWWVTLDFFDTSELPVLSPFTPDNIQADVTSITAEARVASWGKGGRDNISEVGFVLANTPSPSIQDKRVPASLRNDNSFSAAISDLQQNVKFHVRPYIITDNTVYYGRDAAVSTRPRIELTEQIVGLLIGELKTIEIKKPYQLNAEFTWSVLSEQTFNGTDDEIVEVKANKQGSAVIVGKAEGEAVIRVSAINDATIYAEVAVTVARKEKKAGLALTPPMGWSSWNALGRIVDKQKIYQVIDAMTAPITADGQSLKDLGYEYVIVDGGWRQNWLEPDGTIVPNDYFNGIQGMKELVDYAHSKGLKFGLHVLPGIKDCADQYVGAMGNERRHLAEYTEWGLDFLKWDRCGGYGNTTPESIDSMYKRMKYFMDNAGRDIVFSVCNYGFTDWAPSVGHMWRTTGDIQTTTTAGGANWKNLTDIATKNSKTWATAKPGYWNDPDIMVVGDPALSSTEWTSHFNLWSAMAAPLLLSFDLSDIEQNHEALKIVSNPEVIAVNQDALGKQGRPVVKTPSFEVWVKPLVDQSMAVLLVNNSAQTSDITVNWRDVVYDPSYKLEADVCGVRDLWSHTDLGEFMTAYTAKQVPAHGTVMLKVAAKH